MSNLKVIEKIYFGSNLYDIIVGGILKKINISKVLPINKSCKCHISIFSISYRIVDIFQPYINGPPCIIIVHPVPERLSYIYLNLRRLFKLHLLIYLFIFIDLLYFRQLIRVSHLRTFKMYYKMVAKQLTLKDPLIRLLFLLFANKDNPQKEQQLPFQGNNFLFSFSNRII